MNILLCPLSDGGYLYPALAVGRELRRRGHRVSVLGRSTAAPFAAEAGLPFAAAEQFGGEGAFSAARWGVMGSAQYRATVRAARQARADLLVTSVLCNGALLAAETLDVPVVVIGLSIHLWTYRSGGAGEPQYGRSRENRTLETLALYDAAREEVGLPARPSRRPRTGVAATGGGPDASALLGDALLLRGTAELEYPGAELPPQVHRIGPLSWEPAADPGELAAVDAALARSGKPVVYVHLGRFFGGGTPWPRLNATFTGGRYQAVVEQGRTAGPAPDPHADILLVRKPWLGPLVDRAGLVLTAGTSAPVLGALQRGRPLGVTPNGSEQPVLAGALLRAGAAVHLPRTGEPDQSGLVDTAWRDDRLRSHAHRLGRRLAEAAADAPHRAADLVERTARTSDRQPATSRENHGYSNSRPGPRGRGEPLGGHAAVDRPALRLP
ncbi:UDP:flavonoid glycosyltransferase YjiC, YdhE family [Streptomyces sp. TLI_053]|uniref:glycosyltransferase n=1 Tax=Streptomyces sp. TLI_053 TaxID=1855352 RepID=UPI00087DBAC6|nr:glycosyltransferase [Streptomyces sp. TLI_053]SDT82025.1 UDP:flavonoid glycosyltransferase YjiC, YdhE family [Streptomyces sp. TLI_053]